MDQIKRQEKKKQQENFTRRARGNQAKDQRCAGPAVDFRKFFFDLVGATFGPKQL